MKKILLGVLVLVGQPYIMADSTPFPDAFSQLNNQAYNDLVGYDLDFTAWQDTRENVVPGLPTLLLHGFGASPITMVEWMRVAGPNKIPGDVATFRFADATDTNSPNLSLINLGQKPDMLAALVAFKAMQSAAGDSGWNTFGQSRGAATIVNTLALLNQPVDTWDDTLRKSNITEEERLVLLESIKKGVVVLETPLVTTGSGIHGNGKLVIKRYVSLPEIITWPICGLFNNVMLPIVSGGKYVPWGEQALSSVDNLPQGLKVMLHFQKNDKDVSNDYDQVFTEKMVKCLGQDNVWAVLGNDGGKAIDDATWQALEQAKENGAVKRLLNRNIRAHNAGFQTLLNKGVVSALYKKHGGSYVNDEAHLEQGEKILEASSLRNKDLEEYFKNYDVNSLS